ncbi:MAG: cysteine--tRNA ligase [Alphaproteobacteria bacterium]|nr:cysteine--tRNA ligase [Alphaproteobacteria bacterium]
MNIKLYNTMTRRAEEFKPLVPGRLGLYTCGPTVYSYQHIGNMRATVHFDIIARMFRANGYEVNHVLNVTDVGHLVNEDEDSGEDKMEKGARLDGTTAWDVAQKYLDAFVADTDALNIGRPAHMPRATGYIAEQIDMIKQLEAIGYTYIIPGKGVYYDTSKFAGYGKLSGQDLSKIRAGARIDDTGKKNPTDFLLWGFSPTGAKREMEWDSPWGPGFPGWSIECSAMSMKLLGPHFDVHAGGHEHINVHHTNEIAQSEPIVGAPWVNYWVHHEWLMGKDGKMSKSNGEIYRVADLINLGYDPMAFRYLLLLGHYKSPLNFSLESLDAAATGYENIVRKFAKIMRAAGTEQNEPNRKKHDEWRDKILAAVNDNLRTAEALVIVQELLKDADTDDATKFFLFGFIDALLGLQFMDRARKLCIAEDAPVPVEIQALADARGAAKAAKDFARADELRAQVEAAGYAITDGADGVRIVKK